MIRKILGVIAGYAVFVASSIALFQLSGQNPHGPATTGFKVLTAAYGVVFSILGGFVLQLIARTKTLTLNAILAMVIAGFAAYSLTAATGTHWTQLFAIFIFAPVSLLGGLFAIRRNAGRS